MCNKNPKTVSEIIQEIRSGSLSPKLIDKETRKQCVEYLCNQGIADTDIADFFKVHSKTIKRDIELIQLENAISSDPRHTGIMAGIAFKELNISITNLRRLERNKKTSASDKIDIVKSITTIIVITLEKLQSMGIIHHVSQKVITNVNHMPNSEVDFDMLQAEIVRLKEIEQNDLPTINAKIVNNDDNNDSKGTPKC